MMQSWFAEAKLGIFIHWGIYSVKGVAESWSFYHYDSVHASGGDASDVLTYDEYMKQCSGFTASRYDPDHWAELFSDAGAKYAVLTAKHHDGVALWDTQLSDLNVVKKTPAGRDLIGPFCDSLRRLGLKVGLYFSHLDWSHPDYPVILPKTFAVGADVRSNRFSYPQGQEDPAAWERFLMFHRGQLRELSQAYKPDLFWFDGDWERDSDQWRMKELRDFLHGFKQDVILNSRMKGYGDYETPEQAMPIVAPEGVWEFCMTMNDSWGYKPGDKNFKTLRQIVKTFCECIGMGGNLLLDVGPKEDGSIPREAEMRLRALGAWIRRHAEAIYPTEKGLPWGHFYGPSMLSKSKETLYLFVFDPPKDSISLKGVRNRIRNIAVLGKQKKLKFRVVGGAPWMNIPGVLWIDVPSSVCDPVVTVLKVELDGPVSLYRGSGGAIEMN
jgi:alpha-L-fucosidase